MREKKNWLIITFEQTTQAMQMERIARREGAPGRIIPLPTQISAGCGLSWRALPENRAKLEALMRENGISHAGIVELYY